MKARQILCVVLVIALGVVVVHGTARALSRSSGPQDTKRSAREVASSFSPHSVTFISTTEGWALGSVACPPVSTCLEMYRTRDGGRTWSHVTIPTAILNVSNRDMQGTMAAGFSMYGLQVRFANARDGWIFGSLEQPIKQNGAPAYLGLVPRLWSTHDGGLVWRRQPLPWMASHDEFLDVEAANGVVYAMAPKRTYDVAVESSPVGVDDWHSATKVTLGTPAGGGPLTGSFVLHGDKGWLVEGNDRGVFGSAQLGASGTWVPWTAPCLHVGDSYGVPSAASSDDLVVACSIGGYGDNPSKFDPPGATIGSAWLYFSTDGGESFRAGTELRPVKDFLFFSGALAAPAPHVVILSRPTNGGGVLCASFDDGVSWSTVYRGPGRHHWWAEIDVDDHDLRRWSSLAQSQVLARRSPTAR